MQGPSLARARQLAPLAGDLLLVHLAGLASALLMPMLLVVLGFVSELVTLPAGGKVQGEWLGRLGPALVEVCQSIFRVQEVSPEYALVLLLAGGLILAVCESASLYIFYRSVEGTALEVAAQLRLAIHRQAFRLGASDLLGARTSRPEELFGAQVDLVREGAASWWRIFPRSIVALGLLLAVLLLVNWQITLVAALVSILAAFLLHWLRSRADEEYRLWNDRAEQHARMLVESLRQSHLVTGYALPKLPGEPAEEELERYRQADLRARTSDSALVPATLLALLAGLCLILWIVGLQMLRQPPAFTVPGAMVLMAALVAAYFPLARMVRLPATLADAETAAEEIFAYLDRRPSITEVASPKPLARLAQTLVLDNVKLADREGNLLLDGVSLSIGARQRVALVASDAETTHALAGLLVRYYDPAAGRILFDGVDLTAATLDSLRAQCLYAAEDGALFTGTVSENIGGGDDRFTQLQITDAAKLARAYNFIQQLPQGFATQIGRHAMHLDAGQAFRIGLARAVLRNPSLLVLKEPEEPLDEQAAAAVDDAYKRLAAETTLVILPTRIETLRSADRVYLFHEGKLVGHGPHAELLQASDLYRHLTYIRFNSFRTAVKS